MKPGEPTCRQRIETIHLEQSDDRSPIRSYSLMILNANSVGLSAIRARLAIQFAELRRLSCTPSRVTAGPTDRQTQQFQDELVKCMVFSFLSASIRESTPTILMCS